MIEHLLNQLYPGGGRPQAMRETLLRACDEFIASGLADAKFRIELCSGSEGKFWSCISEALLGQHLMRAGLEPQASHGGGPDFLIELDDQKVWIEVTCPEPIGLPDEWLDPPATGVVTFPHVPMLLRWTSAIKEKAEKLLGTVDGTRRGYLDKGTVGAGDAYVIAINGRQLRHGPFPALIGISQFPFAVEAVFAVGPYQILIDKVSLEQLGSGHQHRPLVEKPKGAPVPAGVFLDPRYRPVSAIWAVDVDGSSAIGNMEPMTVVHNPMATNGIPLGLLPALDEFVASADEHGGYTLQKIPGRLAPAFR
jgi:type I restriction enzyme S subunit